MARQHPLASVPPALLSSALPPAAEPSLLPSAIPRTPGHPGDQPHSRELNSPLIHIPPIQEGVGNDDDDSKVALSRRYNAAGANTYEMLGYGDNEDDEDEQEVNSSDEEDEDEPMDRDTFLSYIYLIHSTWEPMVYGRLSVEDDCLVYKVEHIKPSGIQLSKGGLLLYVLLAGGDYNPGGVPGCGPKIAHALAKDSANLGTQLLAILSTYSGVKLEARLNHWRDALQSELQTNASGQLTKHYPKIAAEIPDTFPDISIAHMLSSWSPQFAGITPNSSLWVSSEPSVPDILMFCCNTFGWNGNDLLKKFKNNLWSGVAFRMFSSRYILRNWQNLFASPMTNAKLLKVVEQDKDDGRQLNLQYIRACISISNFVRLAQPTAAVDNEEYIIISLPKVVPAVATRDLSATNAAAVRQSMKHGTIGALSHGEPHQSGSGTTSTESDGVIEVDSELEEEYHIAHRALGSNGIIDLTNEI
ncbi:hypothetical protein DFH07DRAFT_964777 [Mycena maculata]|uniref:XPG-I domain-containing protein n=1 Tax=Mycena maculata TaxID=230809 RepID=A0AAD7IFN4_9AGAR|nr:hypothetical protein DFH07DRAFT_964777 [Mycena maculata]